MENSDQKNILTQHWKSALEGSLQALIIPSVSGFLPRELEEWVRNRSQEARVLSSCALQETFSPFFPLLDWCSSNLQSTQDNYHSVFSLAELYPLHQSLFEAFFKGVTPERKEPLLPGEELYESQRMQQGVWSLLTQVFSDKPTIFILEQFQDLGHGTLNLFKTLFSLGLQGSFFFILPMKVGFEPLNPEETEFWSDFWEIWEDKKLGGRLLDAGETKGHLRRFSLKDGSQALENIKVLMEFFCWDEAAVLGNRLLNLQTRDPGFLNWEQSDTLFSLMGELDLRRGDGVSAQVHWGHLLSRLRERPSGAALAPVWIKMAWAAGLTRDGRQMIPWIDKLLSPSSQTLNPQEDFILSYLRLWCDNLERILEFGLWKTLYRKFIAQGQELEMSNTIAYWLVNPFRMDFLDALSEASYFQDWGMGLCEKIGNDYRLSDAYLIQGHFWSLKGEWDRVLEAYKRSEDLKIALGAFGDLATIYNGRGFFLMETGNFMGAQENYYKALDCLKSRQSFKEIALTLFNLGTNFFRCGHWGEAEQCFSKLLKLMGLLEMENLVFHSKREVMILLALVYFKLDQGPRAYDLWVRIGVQEESVRTEVEMLWFWSLRGWICLFEGDKEGAILAFNQGSGLLDQEKHYLQFMVPYFYREQGDFYKSLNQVSDAVTAYKKGFQASFRFPNFYIRSTLDWSINPTKAPPILPDLGVLRLDFDWIIESGRTDKALRNVNAQKNTLDSLRTLTTLITLQTPETELLQEAMRLFQRTCFFDFLLLIEWDGKVWKEVYSTTETDSPWRSDLPRAMEALRPLGKSVYLTDPKAHTLLASMNLPFQGLVSVQGAFYQEYQLQLLGAVGPLINFHTEGLDSLGLGLELLASHIGRCRREIFLKKRGDELYKASTLDPITGLPNRRSLTEKILEEEARINRYRDQGAGFSVLFLDVDNLGGVNRQLGYAQGDIVLKKLGEMLSSHLRLVDVIGRYGGDEFLILLPETRKEGALALAQRIFESLKEDSWATLTCSLGGAEYHKNSSVLELAEKALKEVKKMGGGSFKII